MGQRGDSILDFTSSRFGRPTFIQNVNRMKLQAMLSELPGVRASAYKILD